MFDAPIYFTKNEPDFSNENRNRFFLYRLFNFRRDPKMFIVRGSYQGFCSISGSIHFLLIPQQIPAPFVYLFYNLVSNDRNQTWGI